MKKSHDPVDNINHSRYHLVCRRGSTCLIIQVDRWPQNNLNGIIFGKMILFHFDSQDHQITKSKHTKKIQWFGSGEYSFRIQFFEQDVQ